MVEVPVSAAVAGLLVRMHVVVVSPASAAVVVPPAAAVSVAAPLVQTLHTLGMHNASKLFSALLKAYITFKLTYA